MSALRGTLVLVRLVLRRERVALPSWSGLLVLMVAGTARRYAQIFPTADKVRSFAEEIPGNRLLVAFGGQLPSVSLAGLTAWKIVDTLFCLIGLMAVLLVVRHTRADEEAGRQELVGACAVGRLAPLTASLAVAWGACALVGALAGLSMLGAGFPGPGSVAFGAAVAAVGCVFAAVAAVAAQLSESARGANMISLVVLLAGWLVRFLADGSGRPWLRWLSPQGLGHLVRPFGGERFSVLGVSLSLAAVLAATAYVLAVRRDLGTGVLPQRPGPASAPRLRGPVGLAWRLHRGLVLGWMIGTGAVAALLGGLASAIPQIAGRGGPAVRELFRRYAASPDATLVDAYLWMAVMTIGYTVALYPVLATLRLRSEEEEGRADAVLATPVGRVRWAASHLVFVALGSAAIMAVAGLAAGLAEGEVARLVGGALVQVPAIWVLGGVATLAFGLLPRAAAGISWCAFLFVNMFGEVLGPALGIEYRIADLAVPFHYLPKVLSGEAFSATPLVALTGLSALLAAAGVFAFTRRDVG